MLATQLSPRGRRVLCCCRIRPGEPRTAAPDPSWWRRRCRDAGGAVGERAGSEGSGRPAAGAVLLLARSNGAARSLARPGYSGGLVGRSGHPAGGGVRNPRSGEPRRGAAQARPRSGHPRDTNEDQTMRLTRLELSGFKSFAGTVELPFETGVTAIVGPNGCGKSNISD